MKGLKRYTILKITMTALCIAMLILSCLYLTNFHRLVTIVCLIIFAFLAVIISSLSTEYETSFKILIVAAVFCSIILVSFILLDQTGLLYKLSDFETIKNIILETRQWGVLTFFFVTLLQIIVLPIPAAVTILIGVAIYGAWLSFFITSAATILGSIISFMIGRSFGKKIIVWVCGPEKTEKYANFLAKGKFAFIFMMIFPFFPDDLICMLAGITNMTKRFFIISMSISRTIVVAVYCFFGSGDIIPFSGWGIPVWIAIFAAIVIAYVVIEKLIIKKKTPSSLNK